MEDFFVKLGDAVKAARKNQRLTQSQLAEKAGVGERTIINLENANGDIKFSSLYQIIRALRIDPTPMFYPERERYSQDLENLKLLIGDCSEQEAADLYPIAQAALGVLRAKDGDDFSKRTSN